MSNEKDFSLPTISEILKYLPPKDLGRFKIVSKPWCNLIQSKYFANNVHLMEMKKQNQYTFLFQEEVGKHPLFYDATPEGSTFNKRVFEDGDNAIELLASCNGLVLFCNAEDVYFLGNPITHDTIVVPNNHICFPENATWAHVFYGLGYDQINQDYKVVRISHFNNDDSDTEVKIFSTKNLAWSRIDVVPFKTICSSPGVFVHGRLHWKVYRECVTYGIVSLDCQTESYDLMQLPADAPPNFLFYDLNSLDDETLILYSHFCKVFDVFEFWIMKEYGRYDSWMKIVIPIGPNIAPDPLLFGLQPLCWLDNNKEIILFRMNPTGTFWAFRMKEDIIESYPLHPVIEDRHITILRIANSIGGPL